MKPSSWVHQSKPNDYVASFVGLSHHGVSITHGHHNQKEKNETRRKHITSITIHKMPIKTLHVRLFDYQLEFLLYLRERYLTKYIFAMEGSFSIFD
jgi:hypothetical protein